MRPARATDTIAAIAEAHLAVVVITTDRGLAKRVRADNAEVVRPNWLLDQLVESTCTWRKGWLANATAAALHAPMPRKSHTGGRGRCSRASSPRFWDTQEAPRRDIPSTPPSLATGHWSLSVWIRLHKAHRRAARRRRMATARRRKKDYGAAGGRTRVADSVARYWAKLFVTCQRPPRLWASSW
jgi:hypothetical protein